MAEHIMIVEDDRDIRDTIQQILELEGYRVLAASNGKEALETIDALAPHAPSRPRVILLDLMMPIMNGWDFLSELKCRKDSCRTPVIVISAVGTNNEIPPANGFLRKPVDLELLLETVKRFCA